MQLKNEMNIFEATFWLQYLIVVCATISFRLLNKLSLEY